MEDIKQRGPGIENGSKWSNGTVHFDRTGPTEKSGPPRKVGQFFRNFPGWTEPIHSLLDRHFRKFWLNGLRPRCTTFLGWTSPIKMDRSIIFDNSDPFSIPGPRCSVSSMHFFGLKTADVSVLLELPCTVTTGL